MKRTIKVAFTDQYRGFNEKDNAFLDMLKEKYNVEVTRDHPDYLIYSVFGSDYLDYDCVRIFYTGECYSPNFNECDYAVGYDRLEYGDRYIRVPNYAFTRFKPQYEKIQTRVPFTSADLAGKEGFCSFVYSNLFAQDKRGVFFDLLSGYKKVDSGGRYKNNIGGAVKDKDAFQASHKFSIAFENCSYPGYTTEKIVDAFAAYTIPIYYGDPTVTKDFNPKAFINCHDFASFEDVVEEVKRIDENDDLYLEMINQPPVLNAEDPDLFKNFLFYIIDQDYGEAFRRPHSMYTSAEEQQKKRHRPFEKYIYRYYKMGKNQAARLKTKTIMTARRTK